jgi:hypothetical protein
MQISPAIVVPFGFLANFFPSTFLFALFLLGIPRFLLKKKGMRTCHS